MTGLEISFQAIISWIIHRFVALYCQQSKPLCYLQAVQSCRGRFTAAPLEQIACSVLLKDIDLTEKDTRAVAQTCDSTATVSRILMKWQGRLAEVYGERTVSPSSLSTCQGKVQHTMQTTEIISFCFMVVLDLHSQPQSIARSAVVASTSLTP